VLACAADTIALSFAFDINVLPCLQMHQSWVDRNPVGEIVLSLASFEGVTKLTQLEIFRLHLFQHENRATNMHSKLGAVSVGQRCCCPTKDSGGLFKY
jgi:hypothetical protein